MSQPQKRELAVPDGQPLKPVPIVEVAFTLPTSPDTKIHLQIIDRSSALSVIVASSNAGGASSLAAMGSLAYALPNRSNPASQPLSTVLYSRASSIDFATRLARILAKRASKPVYVGGEISFWTQEDQMLALRGCVQVVMEAVA